MTATEAPTSVVQIVSTWIDGGRQPQNAIPWMRERWMKAFPKYRGLLEDLPDALDRQVVSAYGHIAAAGNLEAERAFVVVMAWGFGSVGYGPWRTKRILDSTADSPARLCATARQLQAAGPLAAYAEMASRQRLVGLGPAFGTKYLHFCSREQQSEVAVVLDRLVADWLRSNTDLSLNPVPWSLPTYTRYLDHLTRWSEELQVSTAELECCIFQAEANRRARSQWTQR